MRALLIGLAAVLALGAPAKAASTSGPYALALAALAALTAVSPRWRRTFLDRAAFA